MTVLAAYYELLTAIAEPYQPWREQAACRGLSPALFLPERGGSTREAKLVCRCCEVRQECLDYAMSSGERFGIWGMTSERERRVMRRADARRGEERRRERISVRREVFPRRNGAA